MPNAQLTTVAMEPGTSAHTTIASLLGTGHLTPEPTLVVAAGTRRPAPRRRHSAVHMLGVRPRSPRAEPAPCWTPRPAAPGPAKRRRLHQPAGPEPLPAPGLEAPAGPAGAALASTSVVLLAAGCSLQLPLDGVDLLLQPEPTSLLQVSLQGHTIILVPEGILDCARPDPGQPGHAPDGLQVTALLDAPQDQVDAPGDHQVVVIEESWEAVPDIACQEDACDQDADPGILEPWVAAPAGTAAGFLPSAGASMPWSLASSSNAESRAPRPTWDLDSPMLSPFPSSPLQSLPPSPLACHQAQCHPRPPSCQFKVRRRLFHE